MFKVCALMAIYNEEDILRESLEALISDGIDVYIIDNGSQDKSLSIAQEFYGKGVIGIEVVTHSEFGKEVYNWTKILERKRNISLELDYDWFIHADVDEIRCSPWSNISLFEGIKFVDSLGFNLINFKLFNFRLTEENLNEISSAESMSRLKYYSKTEKYNSMQVKAWRKSFDADLVSHGGHLVLVDNSKIFPIRFILKHYPLRSKSQAIRKINIDRKSRFSMEDKSKGWHVQYDKIPTQEDELLKSINTDVSKLVEFNFDVESSLIQREGLMVQLFQSKFNELVINLDSVIFWKYFIEKIYKLQLNDVSGLIDLHGEMVRNINKFGFSLNDYDAIPYELQEIMFDMLILRAFDGYIKGNPFLFDAMPNNFLLKCFKHDLKFIDI